MAKRKKQGFLPGMEPPSIPELDGIAEEYQDTKTERIEVQRRELVSKSELIAKLKEHGLNTYVTPNGLEVSLIDKFNVKCKMRDEPENDE